METIVIFHLQDLGMNLNSVGMNSPGNMFSQSNVDLVMGKAQ